MRRFYESHAPQDTFVPNELGKVVQVSNDSEAHLLVHFGDALLRLAPGALEYIVLHDETEVLIDDGVKTHGPYYTRSDANSISLRRDASNRLLPVYFFMRF